MSPFINIGGTCPPCPIGIDAPGAAAYIRGRPGLEGYQPDGRPAVDASASRVCDILDDEIQPAQYSRRRKFFWGNFRYVQ